MAPVLTNHAFSIHVDRATKLVRFVRTAAPFASMQELEQLYAAAFRVFDQLGRERHALLIDMREAVMNTDPAFEKATARVRPHMVRGFTRVAVLVKTAIGSLQVNRHIREDGMQRVAVHQDEASALAFLVDPDLEPQRRSGFVESAPPSSHSPASVKALRDARRTASSRGGSGPR
jgi:hypothetical protein